MGWVDRKRQTNIFSKNSSFEIMCFLAQHIQKSDVLPRMRNSFHPSHVFSFKARYLVFKRRHNNVKTSSVSYKMEKYMYINI